MGDLQNALKRRFPLLTSLRLIHGSGEEDLASFMGVLLAAMQASPATSFCFVFPKKCELAPLSAALYALGQFGVDFPRLAEQYARTGFKDGERVKLVPEEKVFVFAGLWPNYDNQFRLKLLDDKRNSTFNWPTPEILRIEPTTRKIPKGREVDISIARNAAPLSTLDNLIGTRTFGNPCLSVNYLLYLGGRTEVADFLVANSLRNHDVDVHATLDQLLEPGAIGETGEIRHQDTYQAAGQPLIAISSRIEHIAAACLLAPARSKVVVVDGAKRITDLAKFDEIVASQNLIIVAEPDEEERLQQLYDRGCRFWRFSLADLEMGNANHQCGPFFKRIFRAARNEADFRTQVLQCRNSHLEEATSSLETCQTALDESETDETQVILRQIYSLLIYCSSLVAPPEDADRSHLAERIEKIFSAAQDRIMWLSENAAKALNNACSAMICAIYDPELGKSKGDMLQETLKNIQELEVAPIAILARSVSNRRNIMRWLEDQGFNYPVLLPTGLVETGFFERLICISWPGSGSYGRIKLKFATPEVHLVAYPFERQWLDSFDRKQHSRNRVPGLNASEKIAFLGLSDAEAWLTDPALGTVSTAAIAKPSQIDFEERMTRKGMITVGISGEEKLSGTLVSFLGDAYAFLTDNFRVPVITDLISGVVGGNYKIPRRSLAEMRPGDVLVFRESGRKDVIHALADARIGAKAPAVRERAARWQRALRNSSLDEMTLIRELEQVNCPRTLQSVRGWLNDDFMIGPQTKADLEAIAYALGDQQLLEEVPAVWAAIQLLRGEHLSAGMRLSKILLEELPQRLEEIHEGRTRFEIDNAASCWIVQVEGISDQTEMRPRSCVNALLWDTDDLF